MLALALGLFGAVCWSIHDLLARKLAGPLGAYRMTVLTMLVGFVLLLPAILSSAGWVSADVWQWGAVLLLALVYAAAVSSLFKGFSLAPISIVGPLTAGYPALIVIWGMVHGFVPGIIQVLAILAILVGAVIVGRNGEEEGGSNRVAVGKMPQVIFFCILASVCFAASVVMGQALSPVFGEVATTGLIRLPAALVLLPLAGRERTLPGQSKRQAILFIMAMAAFDVAALTAINYMGRLPFKELGAMGISAYGGVSVVLAMIFLKEKVTPLQWLGIAVIVIGVGVLGVAV